ncbi:MAG: 50S ribosome-binding GTPase [Campylobacteraceae bacterium]|nr:50S ribosome-binding GTPase [Campylobacteraceae bacterium]
MDNFKKELTDIAGVTGAFGLVGAGISIAASMPLFTIGTGAIAGGSILYAGFKSKPKKLLSHQETLNKTILFNELNNIEPLTKVGLVGVTKVGKSTLIKSMQCELPPRTRTEELFATILSVLHTNKYIALIDGPGQELSQQFEIIDNVDILLMIIDHNVEDKNNAKISRIEEQKDFFDQILKYINRKNYHKRIHILVNKEDKWKYNNIRGKSVVMRFADEIENSFKNNPNCKVTMNEHSNFKIADIGKVWKIIDLELINE